VAKVVEVLNASRYRTRAAVAEQYFKKFGDAYVLLAGDAAHCHSPAGGQGMNLGLCDGILLGSAIAGHIDQVRNDGADYSHELFEKYSSTRRTVALRVIRVAETIESMNAFRSWWALALRNFLLGAITSIPFVNRFIVMRISGLVYRDSSTR